MSQHEVVQEEKKFVFGWDQPLMSFFLQVHDKTRDEDDQIIARYGADAGTQMYELQDLCNKAREHNLYIDYRTRVKLHGERDAGI